MNQRTTVSEGDVNGVHVVVTAKTNCLRCYGRGYTGIRRATDELISCKCLKREVSIPVKSNGEKHDSKRDCKLVGQ